MIHQEAAVLCRYVRALCPQQKFDEYTPDAWHDVLAPWDLNDCRTAASNLSGKQVFIAPAEIIAEVKRIRAERLANFVYDPPATDRDPNYLQRYRQQLEEVASGRRPPTPDRPALEGGPHPDVAAAITGIGRTIPEPHDDEKPEPRPGPYGIRCPRCAAHIGRPCHSPHSNRRLARPHPARIRAAEGTPTNPATDQAEQDRRRQAARAYLAALPPHTVIEPADGYQPTPDADSEAS